MQLDGFYEAKVARDIAAGGTAANSVVLTEINAMQVAVDTAAKAGNLSVVIAGGTTTMTSYDNYNGAGTSSYFDAWNNAMDTTTPALQKARDLMARVIGYFTRLGYRISRDRDGLNNRLQFTINW